MIKIKGLAHFSIPVTDMQRSIDFYHGVLGMTLLKEVPPMGMTFMDCGGDCVVLVKVDTPISTSRVRNVHHAFKVASADYRTAVEALRHEGVEILYEENRQEKVVDGPRAYFNDPDGNTLEIIDLEYYAGDHLQLMRSPAG